MPRSYRRLLFLVVAAILLGTCVVINFPAGEPPGTQATPALTQAPLETQSLPTPTQPLVLAPTISPPRPTPLPTLDLPGATLDVYPAGEIFYTVVGRGIMQLEPGNGKPFLLPLPPDAAFPFVSPSGRRLGFVFSQPQQDGKAYYYGVSQDGSLYLPSSRSQGRSLTPLPFLAAWSPDENLVASVNALGGVGPSASYNVQVFGFDPRAAPDYWQVRTTFQVKGLVELVWSPDSLGLVLIAAGEEDQRFFLAPLSQSPLGPGQVQTLQMLFPGETALAVQALPGERLLYATKDGIYLQAGLSEDPKLVTRILAPYSAASFDASGRWAAVYSAEQNGLFSLDLLAGGERQVGDSLPGGASQVLEWSADGRYLAFTQPDELQPGLDDLYVTTPQGKGYFLRTIPQRAPGSRVRNLVTWHPSEPYLALLDHTGSGFVIWMSEATGSGFAYLNPDAPGSERRFSWKAEPPKIELVELPLAPEPCLAFEPRLEIGNSTYSNLEPPVVSLIYRDVGFDTPVIGSLNPGEQAWVLGGPICTQNTNFWLLHAKESGLVGWVAEANSTSYLLVPRSDALLFSIKGKIYALPLDAPELRLVADPEASAPGQGMQFLSPRWRPDGAALVYIAEAPRMSTGLYLQTYPAGAAMDLILPLVQQEHDLAGGVWSPDGSRLVVSLGPKDGKRDLYLVQGDGSLVQNLTGSPTLDDRSPSWSPDGTQIVFLSGEGADTELYVLTPGESIFRLTDNEVEEISPAWSPLGTRIAYAERRGNRPVVLTIVPNGTGRDQLTDEPGWYPAWSPDGQRIAFTDPVNDRLLLVDADGRDLRVLALAGDPQDPVQVVWAPSGGRLAYAYQNYAYIYNLVDNTSQAVAAGLDNPWIAWQP